MDNGLWVWPSDPKGQKAVLQKLADSKRTIATLLGIANSKEGSSNPELDELLANNSNWMTLWPVRQLTSLGLIEYKVDFFGGPGRYSATELGRIVLATMTRQPAQPKVSPPTSPTPQAQKEDLEPTRSPRPAADH
jgi:hypothetical protein